MFYGIFLRREWGAFRDAEDFEDDLYIDNNNNDSCCPNRNLVEVREYSDDELETVD